MSRHAHNYLILDSGAQPLSRAVMESPPADPRIRLRVLDGKEETVAAHEIVDLIAIGSGTPSLQCRLLGRRGKLLELERISVLDPEVRRNLRIPVRFDTLLYPLTGPCQGRRRVESVDLSCGGIAFVGTDELETDDLAELIIPITLNPLILRSQILRKQPLSRGRALYACKFVDLCDSEEALVREAVFNVQVQNRPHAAVHQMLQEVQS